MSDRVYFVTETLAYGINAFVRYTQDQYVGFSTEKDAIHNASARAQRENKSFTVIKVVADINPQPILPTVSVVRA